MIGKHPNYSDIIDNKKKIISIVVDDTQFSIPEYDKSTNVVNIKPIIENEDTVNELLSYSILFADGSEVVTRSTHIDKILLDSVSDEDENDDDENSD